MAGVSLGETTIGRVRRAPTWVDSAGQMHFSPGRLPEGNAPGDRLGPNLCLLLLRQGHRVDESSMSPSFDARRKYLEAAARVPDQLSAPIRPTRAWAVARSRSLPFSRVDLRHNSMAPAAAFRVTSHAISRQTRRSTAILKAFLTE
jgi:hypothetical protein